MKGSKMHKERLSPNGSQDAQRETVPEWFREVAERQGEGGGGDRVRLARLEARGDAGRGGVSASSWAGGFAMRGGKMQKERLSPNG